MLRYVGTFRMRDLLFHEAARLMAASRISLIFPNDVPETLEIRQIAQENEQGRR